MSLPGHEVRVSSWIDLMTTLHSRNLVQFHAGEGNHLRAPDVFRGVDDASWELQASIQRLPKTATTRPDVVERSLLRSRQLVCDVTSLRRRFAVRDKEVDFERNGDSSTEFAGTPLAVSWAS